MLHNGSLINTVHNNKEEAMEEGVRKGMLSTLTGLVADNLLSIREASQRANVSEDDFVKLMHVYQTHILQTRSAYARRFSSVGSNAPPVPSSFAHRLV